MDEGPDAREVGVVMRGPRSRRMDPAARRGLAGTPYRRARCARRLRSGATGELPFLDDDQRREIVMAVRKGAGSSVKIYAGVSGTGVKQVIR